MDDLLQGRAERAVVRTGFIVTSKLSCLLLLGVWLPANFANALIFQISAILLELNTLVSCLLDDISENRVCMRVANRSSFVKERLKGLR